MLNGALTRNFFFIGFFLTTACLGLYAEDFLAFQDQVSSIFNQKKNAVVRVFGGHQVLDCDKDTLEIKQVNVGSGFFISREGHIMTTASIVNNAQCLCIDYNGTPYPAELVGKDDVTNVAIIKLTTPPPRIDFLHLGDSMSLPKSATMLVAVTCQLGADPSPSFGMVTGWHTAFYDDVFPTTVLRSNIPSDAGEAGSPIFDLTGRFVGIITSSVESIRSSFILPARAVMRIRDDLVFSGKVSYACMGFELDKIATIAARSNVVVGNVVGGTPAYEAGIKKDDLILEFDGSPINNIMDLCDATFFARPGQLLTLKIKRGNKEMSLPVRMAEQPSILWDKDASAVNEESLAANVLDRQKTNLNKQRSIVAKNKTISGKKKSVATSSSDKIESNVKKTNFWHNYFK